RGHELGSQNPPSPYPSAQWVRDCERLLALDRQLPGLLDGQAKPASAAAQIEFGQLCALKKLYVAAARFHRDAFTAEPQRAEKVPSGVRYYAACAAALAGCGRGKDADQLDDKARSQWRQQALTWLRADLTWWARSRDNGGAQANTRAQQQMRLWQCD